MKTCPICKEKFTPKFSTLQKACSPKCAIEIASAVVKKENKKAWQSEKKQLIEKNMTTSDWIQHLQNTAFNPYIRERDFGLPCISCGTTAKVQIQAGHYHSTNRNPNLRFDEDNVHGQCATCNGREKGNLIAYRDGLIERIGLERFNALESRRNIALHITIAEIKEKIVHYRSLTKELKQNRFYRV
jgi:5-methylcytosine-specific restriction endonuclease McrA